MSQAELAEKFGVTSPSFGRWENGTEPSYDTLVALAAFFKISIDRLLTEELTPQRCPPRWGGRSYPVQPEEPQPDTVEEASQEEVAALVQELRKVVATLAKVEAKLEKVEAEQLTQRKQIERLGEGK
jgi:transcriptional regulator with XRE-family HTH domain